MKDLITKLCWLCMGLWFGSVSVAHATYKLQKATTVHAGGLYVFEQAGYVMDNTVNSNGKLLTTHIYQTTGLTGEETYVWTLESKSGGYYLKNVSVAKYLVYTNTSTNVAFETKSKLNKYSVWQFAFQEDETVLIQNTVNGATRYLGLVAGETSYKAYSSLDMSYAHAIVVYELVEEEGGNEVNISLMEMENAGCPMSKWVVYDMCGRRVQQRSRGVFLVDGKKVLFR